MSLAHDDDESHQIRRQFRSTYTDAIEPPIQYSNRRNQGQSIEPLLTIFDEYWHHKAPTATIMLIWRLVVWEFCKSDPIPNKPLQDLGKNFRPCFHLNWSFSPQQERTPGFGWGWNAVQFMSGSGALWLYERWCNCLGVLPECSHIYNKPLSVLGRNG